MSSIIISKNPESDISNMILKIGIRPSSSGYRYIRDCLMILLRNPDIMIDVGIVKGVYASVAKKYCTSIVGVERCIRHEVEHIFENGSKDILDQVFYTHLHRPTNKEFIAYLYEYFIHNNSVNT